MSRKSINYTVVDAATLTWTIDNFQTSSNGTLSPYFSLNFGTSRSRNLNLFARNMTSSDVSGSTFFYLYASIKRKFSARYQFSIIDSHGNKQNTKVYFMSFLQADFPNSTDIRDFPCVASFNSSACSKYLVTGKLTIMFEIDILQDKPDLDSTFPPPTSISSDIQSLLASGQLSDVTLIVQGKEFAAHKAILGARSPVFVAMFSHDFKEKIESKVEVPDISIGAFEQLLAYIYTDKMPDLKEHAVELFKAADKYQFDSLKSTLIQAMGANLSVGNVAGILLLADQHELVVLKKSCLKFIVKNYDEISKTDSLAQINAANPKLMIQMFGDVVKNAKTLFD